MLTGRFSDNTHYWYHTVQENGARAPSDGYSYKHVGDNIELGFWDDSIMGAAYPGDAVINAQESVSEGIRDTIDADFENWAPKMRAAVKATVFFGNTEWSQGRTVTGAEFKAKVKSYL